MRGLIALAVAGLLAGGCGSGTAGGGGRPGYTAFKTTWFAFAAAPATPPGDVTSITVTAPAAGAMRVVGAGYCNALASPSAIALGISSASAILSSPSDTWFAFVGAANSVPFYVEATFPVAAGANTFFLVSGPGAPGVMSTATNLANCSGNLTAFFAAQTLP